MHFRYEESERCPGLYLAIGNGHFDTLYCSRFGEIIDEILAKSPKAVGYHLQKVPYMNSTAFGAVLKAHHKLIRQGAFDFFVDPSAFVRDMATSLGIHRVIPIKTLDAVVQELSQPLPPRSA